MNVTIGLAVVGTDEAPRWAAGVSTRRADYRNCCAEGHYTPEAAAAHGTELAAVYLSQHARSLVPPACGALALAAA